MLHLETRYDPIHGYGYTYWPDSKYFKNYRFSPPISWTDDWTSRSRVWFPYYWSTRRLFQHYMDSKPSTRSLRAQRKTIYLDYPYTTTTSIKALEYPYPSTQIKALDYSYYPYSYRYYRPLSLYYDYYWPLTSLNRYSSYWPSYYNYNRYLYYKYTLPSDRYYYLKGKMIYLRDPISYRSEFRMYPTSSYLRHKIYKPLSLYSDYYEPIRSLFWDSSYWPLYKSTASFIQQCGGGTGNRLQRIFDDETRLIRAQTASLLKRIHDPVPRVQRYSWPLPITTKYYDDSLPARWSNDNYIHRLLVTSPKSKSEYTTYYTEPVRKYIGGGHLASVSYAGDRAYSRRPHLYLYDDPLKSDIQLMSYYINKFKQDKAIAAGSESPKVPLNPARPTRKFGAQKVDDDEETARELQKLRDARAARLAFINEEQKVERSSTAVDDAVKAKKQKEEERLAEEKALAEEQTKKETQAKKAEESARKAELARQEELAAQAAAEKAADLERKAELARKKELAKQAEIDKARKAEEERLRLEDQRRQEEEAKADEVRKQQERLEELARQAKEEEEAELVRQAEELAELARQEAELAEQAKKEADAAELIRQEEELADLARQEAELEELERKEQELVELAERAREEAEAAQLEAEEAAKREEDEIARRELEVAAEEDAPTEEDLIQKASEEEASKAEEELAKQQAELEELARQEAELAELERQQAELDALEAEAKALECEIPEEEYTPAEEEEDEEARKQREMDDMIQQRYELAELERQQAELDALEAEAKALEEDVSPAADDDEDEPAIAEDTPVQSDVEE